MRAKEISIDKAKQDKLFYFVTTIVVHREGDQRCLILKRDKGDEVYPNKWALPGGRLGWSDFDLTRPDQVDDEVLNFNNPIEDHVFEIVKGKTGIETNTRPKYLGSVFFVRPDGTPSVLVRFVTRYIGGEVKPQGGFVDFKWVDAKEIDEYDHIEGINMDILKTIKLFS